MSGSVEKSEHPSKVGRESSQDKLLARRVGRFSFATILSRLLGYARDAAIAHFIGGGHLADAFFTSFRISNLFRRLLGEGALSSSLIPVFTYSLKNEPQESTIHFLNSFFTTILLLLSLLTFLGILFAPQLTLLIAPGFRSLPEKFAQTVELTQWMFPFFLFISLAALISAILNSLKHFFLPAVAPAMLSALQIFYLFLIFGNLAPAQQMIGLALTVVLGGAAHLLVQLPLLKKENFLPKFRWNLSHPHSLTVFKLMLPAIIGLSVEQVNTFVDTVCATFLTEGSVTALYNANRVMQLPLALFGIAIATVSLPALAEFKEEKNYTAFADTLNDSLRIMFFCVMPACAGLFFLAGPIVKLLFQHGQFSAEAAELTASALRWYSVGLLAYSAVKILANAFYSLRKPSIPVQVAAICMLVNVCLNLILMGPLGVGGLALATALSSWLNALWLYWKIKAELHSQYLDLWKLDSGRKLLSTIYKTFICCCGLLSFLWGLKYGIGDSQIPLVVLGVPGGAVFFFFLARLLKMEEQKLFSDFVGLQGNVDD